MVKSFFSSKRLLNYVQSMASICKSNKIGKRFYFIHHYIVTNKFKKNEYEIIKRNLQISLHFISIICFLVMLNTAIFGNHKIGNYLCISTIKNVKKEIMKYNFKIISCVSFFLDETARDICVGFQSKIKKE